MALVGSNGQVRLRFRIARFDEHVPVVGADGRRYESGCYLVARAGTMRRPSGRDRLWLPVNLHGRAGAFAYFEPSSGEKVVYELKKRTDDPDPPPPPRRQRKFPFRSVPLFANNIGKTLSQPEQRLILAYTNWIGDVQTFVHHPLKQTGLYTDLFIPRRWTLVEAKSNTDRRTLREAAGQLFDYQRHYDRSPRLAVLVPERPPANVMGLFKWKRIVVIWRTKNGAFRDTAEGFFTTGLRRPTG